MAAITGIDQKEQDNLNFNGLIEGQIHDFPGGYFSVFIASLDPLENSAACGCFQFTNVIDDGFRNVLPMTPCPFVGVNLYDAVWSCQNLPPFKRGLHQPHAHYYQQAAAYIVHQKIGQGYMAVVSEIID